MQFLPLRTDAPRPGLTSLYRPAFAPHPRRHPALALRPAPAAPGPPGRRARQRGVPDGDPRELSLDSISRIGTHFTRGDAAAVPTSYAEVLLLQAEAAERGWIAGDAGDLHRRGIAASLQQLGVARPTESSPNATSLEAAIGRPGGAGLDDLLRWDRP